MIKVIVTEHEFRKAESVFAHSGQFECIPSPSEEATLAAHVRDVGARYVIIGVEKYAGPIYDALPKGGVIARFGVGHDGVDKAKASKRGILCTNTPGVLDQSVAECAIGLMISAARGFVSGVCGNRKGQWNPCVGLELSGKNLAVIGCGAIGKRTASIASKGFGISVIGCDTLEPAGREDWGIQRFTESFDEAVKDADFVSLHIPHMQETENFINADRLEKMAKRAILINTARGGVIDENALFDALTGGDIAGAALDVFQNEPYVPQVADKDLRTLGNVIMTPHIGSSTVEACNRMAKTTLRNIELAIAGNSREMNLITQ